MGDAFDDLDDLDDLDGCGEYVIDELDLTIAIERAMRGEPVRLTTEERRQVTSRLTARGMPAWEIARLLARSERQVFRYRADLRERETGIAA